MPSAIAIALLVIVSGLVPVPFAFAPGDSAPGARKEVTIAGETLIFVWVPSGEFSREDGSAVTLTDGFWMSASETPVSLFRAFVTATSYKTDAERHNGAWAWSSSSGKWEQIAGITWKNPGYPQNETNPAVCVSWDDAQKFISWAGKSHKGGSFSLPTEAQWEHACRAGSVTRWPWGSSADQACEFANVADQTTFSDQQFPDTANCADGHWFPVTVNRFRPNRWGLYDMIGNVHEWCADSMAPLPEGKARNPKGPGRGKERVIRGGSAFSRPEEFRSSARASRAPDVRSNDIGFRLILGER